MKVICEKLKEEIKYEEYADGAKVIPHSTLEEILRDSPRASIQNNLLLPENRDRFKLVMNRLGLPKDCSYDDFAKKFGGITRQKYIELIKERCE